MNHNDGFFKDSRNSNIYFQNWLPETEAKASIIVVHGIAEHSGRYEKLANCFVPSGYAVHAIDHIGHGKSDGIRIFVDRFQDYVDTLAAYTRIVSAQWGDKPLFLLGHSMGGLIAALYLIERQREFTGAVLSGPLIKPGNSTPAALVGLVSFLSTILPRMRLLGLDATYISRDPQVVKDYIEDPLVFNGKITARLAAELANSMKQISSKAGEINLPLLVVQGGADRLVDPQGTQMLFDKVQSSDKTIKIYDGLFHEVFNEPEGNNVLNEVKAWTDSHLTKIS
jgi:alpha-beta hydrolase superfamily lysophospholipase